MQWFKVGVIMFSTNKSERYRYPLDSVFLKISNSLNIKQLRSLKTGPRFPYARSNN